MRVDSTARVSVALAAARCLSLRCTAPSARHLIVTSPGGTGKAQCIASSAYDGRHLYVAATATVIAGHHYAGSVRRLDPGTGAMLWQTGLPNGVIGTPTVDGAGVLAVGTYGKGTTPNAVYLLNAATGRILHTVITGSTDFAESAFAGGWLFTANGTGVYAWAPRAHAHASRPSSGPA